MGKIIYYDFRRQYRQELIEAINKSAIVREGLLQNAPHLMEAQAAMEEATNDEILLRQLMAEEQKWKEVNYKWVEQY